MFSSPLPNRQVWNAATCGSLQAQDFLHQGGWWHNPNILAAVGEGIEKEEPRAWEGCWNENIVELVKLSMNDDQALSVLLTGRQESGFSDLISRMIAAKGLTFDMVCLKPTISPIGETFKSTMLFKQALLRDIVFTYTSLKDLRIYEDRVKHVKGFRDFFTDLNKSLMPPTSPETPSTTLKPFIAEVIHVSEQESSMDSAAEIAEVQKMINVNNKAILDGAAPPSARPYKIKRSVFYTGYLVEPPDIERLRSLIQLPPNCPEHEVKQLANNILITPRPAPRSILDKVGGIGAKMSWKVVGIAVLEQRIWAVRVQPLVPGAKFYTENHTPCVVLATRRSARPIEATQIRNWQPVSDHLAFEFETTVGEKVILRIERELSEEDDYEASFPNARSARKHSREDEFPPLGTERAANGKYQRGAQNDSGNTAWQNRGGGGGPTPQRGGGNTRAGGNQRGGRGQGFHRRRGNDGRGGGRGRGRGGYRSLDDNVGQGYGTGGMQY